MRKLVLIGASVVVLSLIAGLVVYAAADKQRISRQVFDELISQGRYDLLGQIYTRDCKVHFRDRDASLSEAVAEGKGWRAAAPDLTMTPEQVSVSGDMVTVRWTVKATNTGHGNGANATGKHVMLHGSSRFRFVNGQIAEVWNDYDEDDLYRQVGLKNPHHR